MKLDTNKSYTIFIKKCTERSSARATECAGINLQAQVAQWFNFKGHGLNSLLFHHTVRFITGITVLSQTLTWTPAKQKEFNYNVKFGKKKKQKEK